VASICRASRITVTVAVAKLGLDARRIAQVLAVSRTLADLAGGGAIRPVHLAEAIQYQTFGLGARETASSR
jgi:magnesium chelatase family protein